jgi:hypothetical protein
VSDSSCCGPRLQRRGSAIGWRATIGPFFAVIAGVVATLVAQETLVERTVAIVGGAVITASDVRTALALGLVEAGGPDAERDATARLIDRRLMLLEVARFAPTEPAAALIDGRVATVTARAGSADALAAMLARGGYGPGWLAAWVRDDLRIAAYLDQRFATAGAAGEAEVAGYARLHADELAAAGVAAENRLPAARERLQAERRRDLIADWLAELRRRTTVVEIKD